MNKDLSKEEYREKKKLELDNLFAKLNDETMEVAYSNGKYRTYLDVQARLNRYSVSNAILVAGQRPEALQLKSFDDWKQAGVSISKGEKGISILEPVTYQKADGSQGKAFNVKKVFDISQTDAEPREYRVGTGKTDRALLKALISEPAVAIEVVTNMENGRNAEFNLRNQKIYIRRDLDNETFFRDVCKELAHAAFAENNYSYERESYHDRVQAVAYMMCRRYGVSTDGINPVLPNEFKEMKYKDIRARLSESRVVMGRLNSAIEQSFQKQKSERQYDER